MSTYSHKFWTEKTHTNSDLHENLFFQEGWWGFGMINNETNPCEAACLPMVFNSEDHADPGFRPLITFTYDLPAPAITLESPANDSFYSDFINETLNFSVTDNEPFIREVVVFHDL